LSVMEVAQECLLTVTAVEVYWCAHVSARFGDQGWTQTQPRHLEQPSKSKLQG